MNLVNINSTWTKIQLLTNVKGHCISITIISRWMAFRETFTDCEDRNRSLNIPRQERFDIVMLQQVVHVQYSYHYALRMWCSALWQRLIQLADSVWDKCFVRAVWEMDHCCTDTARRTVLQRTKKMLIHFVVTGRTESKSWERPTGSNKRSELNKEKEYYKSLWIETNRCRMWAVYPLTHKRAVTRKRRVK